MSKTRLQDLPSGHDGTGYATIGGRTVEAFHLAKISAKAEGIVESKQFLEERVEQNAARGLKVNGDVEYYHCTSKFIEAVKKYKNGGEYPEITLQYYAQSGKYGRREVILTGVILNEIPFGAIDDSSTDAIRNSTSFTANDFDIIEKFEE